MFYDGVFDNLDGMKHVKPVPMHMLMDYVPDVAAFKEHDFKGADTYVCVVRTHLGLPFSRRKLISPQSKLKRTKQFYVPQYEALKALTSPEVCHGLLIPSAMPFSDPPRRSTRT